MVLSNDVKEKIKLKASQTAKRSWLEGKLTGKKTCSTENYSIAAKNRWADPIFKEKMKSRRWMYNGKNTQFVLASEFDLYITSGWVFGRGAR